MRNAYISRGGADASNDSQIDCTQGLATFPIVLTTTVRGNRFLNLPFTKTPRPLNDRIARQIWSSSMEQLKAALTFLAARAFARLFARANLRRFKRRRLARANNRVYATINGSGVADDASNRNNQRCCINSSASITSASALWIIRIKSGLKAQPPSRCSAANTLHSAAPQRSTTAPWLLHLANADRPKPERHLCNAMQNTAAVLHAPR